MRWFRLRTLAVALAALLVLLVVGGLITLRSDWLRRWLRQQAVTRLAAVIDGDVEIGSLSGSLLRDITIQKFAIRQQGQPVVLADRVDVQYSLVQLLRGQLVLSDVHLTNPFVHVAFTSQGWNLAHLTKPQDGPTAGPWALTLQHVRLTNGRVVLDMSDRPTLRLAEVAIDGRVLLDSSGADVTLNQGSFREEGTGTAISRLAGHIASDGEGVAFKGFQLAAPGLDARADAQVQGGRVSGVDAQVTLAKWQGATLQGFLPWLGQVPVLSGTVGAKGAGDALGASWSLEFEDGGSSQGDVRVDLTRAVIPLKGQIRAVRLNPALLVHDPQWRGRVSGDVQIDGTIDPARIRASSASFVTDNLAVTLLGYAVERARLKGSYRATRVNAAGDVAAYGATASVRAVVDLPESPRPVHLNATGFVSHLDVSRLPVEVTSSIPSDVTGDYAVTYSDPTWRASLTSRESRVKGVTLRSGTIASAEGRGNQVKAAIRGEVADLPASMLGAPAAADYTLAGRVDGWVVIPNRTAPFTLDSIEGALQGTIAGESSTNQPSATADVDASLSHGLIQVRKLDVQSPVATVTAKGQLALASAEGTESQLQYQLDAHDLAVFEALGAPALGGAAHSEGTVTGPAGTWNVAGTFGGHQLAYADKATALTINGTFDGTMPAADPAKATGKVSLDGSFINVGDYEILRAKVDATYRGEQADGRQIDLVGKLEQQQRAIEFDTGVILHTDHRELHLRQLTLGGLGEPWRLLPTDQAVVRYSPRELELKGVALTRGQERFEANGTVALDASSASSSSLEVKATQINIGDVYQLTTGTPRIAGTLDGHVVLTGVVSDPNVTADISVTGGKIVDVPFSSIKATATMKSKMVDLNARLIEQNGAAFDVSGTVPASTTEGEADLHVVGAGISLGVIQAATTAVTEVQGIAGVDARVHGPLKDIRINGQVQIGNAAFRVAASGVKYQDLNTEIRFDDEWAVIDRMTLTDDDGHALTMSGRTGIRATESGRAVEASITADSIHVLHNELGDVQVSADLKMTGAISAPKVAGRVVATKARVEVDELLRRLAGPAAPTPQQQAAAPGSQEARALTPSAPDSEAPSTEAPGNAVPTDSKGAVATAIEPGIAPPVRTTPSSVSIGSNPWAQASLDIEISLPDNVVLRGRNLKVGSGTMGLGDINLTIGGNVSFRKDPNGEPLVVGAVEAVRGFYDFQGRRFTVVRGSAVTFRGPQPSNPSLSITGEREVSGVTAQVRVTGTARRPQIALSSQPPLDEADVLALIVFNQPLNQLGDSQQVDLLQRAGDMALGAIASSLTSSIGRSLDVDLFEVRAPTTGKAGELELGRQVGERVFVGFRQQFGSGEASRLSIEYRLTEALRLLTSFGQGADRNADTRDRETAGADLVYTIRY
ncbi:MAG: translocation/assembly module TamB domain-containing protein [Acidobacteriota bacterium]